MTDEEFTSMINEALESSELTPLQLGDFLGVSGPTVKRWMKGTNLPYNALRGAIKKAVDKRLYRA
jgi:hypothetical protein